MIDFTRLDDIRRQRPLVHCVSNIVSANDCANLALAVGASPIMAQAPQEMADITAASRATVLNTGTPDEEKFRACALCAAAAAPLGQPVVLDPVGEAQALACLKSAEQGVDSPAPAAAEERLSAARALARRYGAAVLLSGPEDIVTDGERAWRISGGSRYMARVTGTGCMLSVLCGAFAAVETDAAAAAVLAAAFWKVCAQRAEQAAGSRGAGSFRTALLDAADTLTAKDFAAEAEIEIL